MTPRTADWSTPPVATGSRSCASGPTLLRTPSTSAVPAGDQHEYWDLLDRVLELAIDNDTLLHRLATRTTNSYGKDPVERDAILSAYSGGWVESYRKRRAVIIDATRPLDEVVAAVIAAAEG